MLRGRATTGMAVAPVTLRAKRRLTASALRCGSRRPAPTRKEMSIAYNPIATASRLVHLGVASSSKAAPLSTAIAEDKFWSDLNLKGP
jgi:hypothetical protein